MIDITMIIGIETQRWNAVEKGRTDGNKDVSASW